MKGRMVLNAVRGGKYEIFGGPYANKPRVMRGLCMAEELCHLPADVHIPTQDYQTPEIPQLIAGLDKALDILMRGDILYVGCMGGIGRTGLFMAAIAKLWGVKDPVKYVRVEYIPNAVETDAQRMFISKLKFPWSLRMKAFRAKVKSLIGPRNKNLTDIGWVDYPTRLRIGDLRARSFEKADRPRNGQPHRIRG